MCVRVGEEGGVISGSVPRELVIGGMALRDEVAMVIQHPKRCWVTCAKSRGSFNTQRGYHLIIASAWRMPQ